MSDRDLRLHVRGVGVLGAFGRGLDALRAALGSGWQAPVAGPGGLAAYRVPAQRPDDAGVRRLLRRADRLSTMATLAALDALDDAGLSGAGGDDCGVVVGTGLGPHATTFAFLDDILDFGDDVPSPTSFSHSVHNAAASYVATARGIRGPTVTVSQFGSSIHTALALAASWLAEGRCGRVLVGAADECGPAMERIVAGLVGTAPDGRIRPFACARRPVTVPGEGAAFFVVTADDPGGPHCRVDVLRPGDPRPAPSLRLLDADGLSTDESPYAAATSDGVPVASYTPLFGGTFSGSALHAAVAVLALRDGRVWRSPVEGPAGGPRPASPDDVGAPRRIECVRYDCDGAASIIAAARV